MSVNEDTHNERAADTREEIEASWDAYEEWLDRHYADQETLAAGERPR